MIELPKDIQDVIDLAMFGQDSKARQFAWKLLSLKLERHRPAVGILLLRF